MTSRNTGLSESHGPLTLQCLKRNGIPKLRRLKAAVEADAAFLKFVRKHDRWSR